MTIQDKIKQLEEEKTKLEKQLVLDEKATEDALCGALVGKYFKSTNTILFNENPVPSGYISYIKFNQFHGKKQFSVNRFDFHLIKPGFKIHNNNLVFVNGQNQTIFSLQNYFKRSEVNSGKSHSYPTLCLQSITPEYFVVQYDTHKRWEECTEEEYLSAMQDSIDCARSFYNTMSKYVTLEPFYAKHNEVLEYMNPVNYEKLNQLVTQVKDGKVSLEKLLLAGGKIAKYNFFDSNCQLSELNQYDINGDKGLHLSIVGGDGGTDYEPYVTHYYIDNVKIDWPYILYPIRQRLSCKVFDLVEKLENEKLIYAVSSWDCFFNTSTYDAHFEYASLKPHALAKVNQIIKENLK